jgi:hypothetical protein
MHYAAYSIIHLAYIKLRIIILDTDFEHVHLLYSTPISVSFHWQPTDMNHNSSWNSALLLSPFLFFSFQPSLVHPITF